MYLVEDNFNEAYLALADTLVNHPDYRTVNRKGERVYEILNASFQVLDPRNCFATCREMSLKYLEGELYFYGSGSPRLYDIAQHAPFWENCTDDGWSVNSNYGKLLLHDVNARNWTQYEYVLRTLAKNPNSKKAVAVIYRDFHAYPSNDNPCTMYLQFFIRENRLHIFVKMRSSDIWFGLPYDVPFFTLILCKLHKDLQALGHKDLELGTYNHQSGSQHLYERNLGKIQDMLDEDFREEPSVQKGLFDRFILPYISETIDERE